MKGSVNDLTLQYCWPECTVRTEAPHMLLPSVRCTAATARRGTVNLKPLRSGQQLEFKLQHH